MDEEVPVSLEILHKCRQSLNLKAPFSQLLPQLEEIRRIICIDANEEEIEVVLDSGLYKELINYSSELAEHLSGNPEANSDMVKVLELCLLILINLCSDESGGAEELVECGLIELTEKTLQLLKYVGVVNKSLLIIGNLIGEQSSQFACRYLKSKVFYKFFRNNALSFWDYESDSGKQLSLILFNTFRWVDKVELDGNQEISKYIKEYLPIINLFLKAPTKSKQTTSNLFGILSNLTLNNSCFEIEIDKIVSPRFPNSPIEEKRFIITICGFMASHTDFGVSVILNSKEMISFLINSLKENCIEQEPGKKFNNQNFEKTCGWILSNILAGTPQQIDYLLERNPIFFNEIFEIINSNYNLEVVKEVMWAVSNLLSSSSDFVFETLYRSNILVLYSEKLASMIDKLGDESLASVFMRGIKFFILKVNKNPEIFSIQTHQKQVILLTLRLLRSYVSQDLLIELEETINDLEAIVVVDELGMVLIN